MERPEKPERKERPERPEKRARKKTGPKPKESGVYDTHFSLRMGPEHNYVLEKLAAKHGATKGEVVRDMIMTMGRKLEQKGLL